MSRSGFSWRDRSIIAALAQRLAPAAGWEGAFTHFHSAGSDAASVRLQLECFAQVLAALPRRPPLVHTASSAASEVSPALSGDLVRPGIFLYGGRAGRLIPEPVARLSARVVAVRRLAPGDPVSYGAEWKAAAPTTIATLAIGYADGILRSLGNRGVVELADRVLPIAGRVTMDMTMIDAGDLPVRPGDIATVFGGRVSLDDQAERAGTVSYELLTSVSARVPRRYHLAPG